MVLEEKSEDLCQKPLSANTSNCYNIRSKAMGRPTDAASPLSLFVLLCDDIGPVRAVAPDPAYALYEKEKYYNG